MALLTQYHGGPRRRNRREHPPSHIEDDGNAHASEFERGGHHLGLVGLRHQRLDALCDVLDLTPGDLLERESKPKRAR